MTAIAGALSAGLLHFVWQAAVTAALLWVVLFLMRRRSANARYLASCAAMAVLVALPAITAWTVYARDAVPASPAHVAEASEAGVSVSGVTAPASMSWMAVLLPWTLPVWSLGVLFFSIRLVWGCRQVALLRRRGDPASSTVSATVATLGTRLGLARPVRVLMTAASGPSVVGWMRPVILLPAASLLGLSAEQLEAVLAHELAHIRRHDYLVNMAQTLVETLLFYHPAVWWTSARIRHERELCCDDLAVRSCGDAVCYARALTILERLRATTPSLAMGSTGGSMLYRVQRLVGVKTPEYGPSKLSGILALSLGLACFAVNLHWARGESQEVQTGEKHVFLVQANQRDRAGVSVDLGGAQVIHRTSVEYPGLAMEKGIEGTVVVEATLDAAGNVSDARVVSGPAELRKVPLQAVLQWHFMPESAGSTRQVSITFRADEARAGEREEPKIAVAYQPGTSERREAEEKRAATAGPAQWSYAVTQESPGNEARSQEQLAKMAKVEAQIGAVEAAIESQQGSAGQPDSADRNEALGRLQRQLLKLRAQREQTLGGLQESGTAQTRLQEGSGQLPAAMLAEESARREEKARIGMAGRVLKSIDVAGLTDAVRAELVSRLNVHVGDTLTADSMESITKAVRGFDEHLEVNLSGEDGDGVALRISAPNMRMMLQLRK